MRTGQLPAARFALGVMALVLAAVTPAAAASLEGYWELEIRDLDGEGNCKIREHTLAAVFQRDGGTHGRLGKGLYENIEVEEKAVNAETQAVWDGPLSQAAIEAGLKDRVLWNRFEGELTEGGDEIEGREIAQCGSHDNGVLNDVREVTNKVRLKRVDLAVAIVQQVEGAWEEVWTIDFGKPFHIEIRASQALSQEVYPVMLAWLEAPWVLREGPVQRETAMTVRRVGDDATLYRSGPIEIARLSDDAPGPRAGPRGDVQILELTPDTKIFATAGRESVPMLAATARVGWLFYVIAGAALVAGLGLLGGLGFGVMKAASFAAAKLGLGRRALSQSLTQAGEADAPAEDETEPDAQPDFSATAHRDGGKQQVEKLEPGEAPVIRFHAGAGKARSSIDLDSTPA